MMRAHRASQVRVLILNVMILFAVGCTPGTLSLSASPSVLCGPGMVTLSWTVSGYDGYRIDMNGQQGSISQQDFTGSTTQNVNGTTTYSLFGIRGLTAYPGNSVTVEVGVPSQLFTISLTRDSCSGQLVTYTVDVKPTDFFKYSSNEVIQNVQNTTNRKIEVSHGVTTGLDRNQSTGVFNGQSPLGTWKVTTKLLPGEECPSGNVVPKPGIIEPPEKLELLCTYGCK